MNRREAMQAIGATVISSTGVPAMKDMDVHWQQPRMLVVRLRNGVNLDENHAHRIQVNIQKICAKAGWGENFPVFVVDHDAEITNGTPPSVEQYVLPPGTVVEQFEGYMIAYPADKPPAGAGYNFQIANIRHERNVATK